MRSSSISSCRLRCLLGFCAGFFLFAGSIQAVDEAYGPIIAREIITGLSQPLFVTTPPHDNRHLFVLEKGGSIRIFDRDEQLLLPAPLLTISPITSAGERGLLGLAFHPDFPENRFFFVNFTNASGNTVVRRYRMDGPQAPYSVEAGSALDLLTVPQPYSNHNGGWIGFSPVDGYLYIALGDGGSGNDPDNNGQNKNTLLGAMLRIDVDGDDFPLDVTRNYAIPAGNPFVGTDGSDEIWAWGLRNPWRNSFDRQTGDLWIADVGQSSREEINHQSSNSPGGENYGWRLREGTIANPTDGIGGPRPPGNVDPVYEYTFSDGRKSIAGGYVYRGSAMPQLRGHYFFADYVADFVKSFLFTEGEPVNEPDVIDWTAAFGNISNPASFGEDADGELYVVSLSGRVLQITQSSWFLWRNRHFSDAEIQDPNSSGPEATPRGDGIPNLVKYALGLDPTQPVSGKLPLELAVETINEDRYLALTIERSPDATDVSLVVEASDDLDGTWSNEQVIILMNEPETLQVRDSIPLASADRRFLRLRVTPDFIE